MKLLKSFILAISLVFSLGAVAGPSEDIDIVLGHVAEAIKAIDAGKSQEEVREHIKASLRVCKEITGKEMLEKKRLKHSRLLKKARTALKKGEPQKAKDFLIETEKKFESLKRYI